MTMVLTASNDTRAAVARAIAAAKRDMSVG
jgi:hypothetical protein